MVPAQTTQDDRKTRARRRAVAASTLLVIASLAALAAPAPAQAQGAATGWTYDLALYGWASGMEGEAGAKGVTAPVDASFADVVDNLQMAGMLGVVARHGRWVILGDAFYAGLGATKKGDLAKAEVDTDMVLLEGDVGYDLGADVQLFGGVRYYDLSNKLVLTSGEREQTAKGGESWADPIVGLRWGAPIGERGTFWLRGDVGGFGVGSDLAWNALAGFGYTVGAKKTTTLALAYRVLDVDYESGSGGDRFLFDMRLSGPIVGAIFHFR